MTRIDIWDVPAEIHGVPIDAGFPRGFAEKYKIGGHLGSGGFGVVHVAIERATGVELAVKTIPKKLNIPNINPLKVAEQVEHVKREVEVHLSNLCSNKCIILQPQLLNSGHH